jgi:ABC-2 type transport system permease protein
MESLNKIKAIIKREFVSYFESPVAYVFIISFLILLGFLTFFVSNLYEYKQADLRPFFFWHPWVFLLLVPAVTMRLWAEERRTGTIETLFTLPITITEAILGKFIAAWLFMTIIIICTFPVVLTVAYLGNPDKGAIIGGYIGSFLMAGAYLSVGVLTSAMTKNQVISFVLSIILCLFLALAGFPPVIKLMSFAPSLITETIASMGFIPHFESFQKGIVDLRDVAYFLSIMVFMLFATNIVLENRKTA